MYGHAKDEGNCAFFFGRKETTRAKFYNKLCVKVSLMKSKKVAEIFVRYIIWKIGTGRGRAFAGNKNP